MLSSVLFTTVIFNWCVTNESVYAGACLHHQCPSQGYAVNVWKGWEEKRPDQELKCYLRADTEGTPDLCRGLPWD